MPILPKGECGESLKVAVTALIDAYTVIEQRRLMTEVLIANTLDQILHEQKNMQENIIKKLEEIRLFIPE